jgi:hypothetical protein
MLIIQPRLAFSDGVFWKIESFIFRFQLLWNSICMTNPIGLEPTTLQLAGRRLYATLCYATLRYATLLYATLRYSTLLYATLY